MFDREADWATATTLICDIMRGSAAIEVETHLSKGGVADRVTYSSSWRYEQTQAHQVGPSPTPRPFSLEGLRETLAALAGTGAFQAYEIAPDQRLGADIQESLLKLSAIIVSFVRLTVGPEVLSWVLVSLSEPRDVILWKLQYHLRDAKL